MYSMKCELMKFWKCSLSLWVCTSKELRKKYGVKKAVKFPLCDAILLQITVLHFSPEIREEGTWLLNQLWDSIATYLIWCNKADTTFFISRYRGEDLECRWWCRTYSAMVQWSQKCIIFSHTRLRSNGIHFLKSLLLNWNLNSSHFLCKDIWTIMILHLLLCIFFKY